MKSIIPIIILIVIIAIIPYFIDNKEDNFNSADLCQDEYYYLVCGSLNDNEEIIKDTLNKELIEGCSPKSSITKTELLSLDFGVKRPYLFTSSPGNSGNDYMIKGEVVEESNFCITAKVD